MKLEEVGNKVSESYIVARILDVKYLRPDGTTLTICIITLDNGFTSIGESACVDLDNYDETIGKQIAHKRAFDKLWPLFGFLLAESIYENQTHLRDIVSGARS